MAKETLENRKLVGKDQTCSVVVKEAEEGKINVINEAWLPE